MNTSKFPRFILIIVVIAALAIGACAPKATPEPTAAPAQINTPAAQAPETAAQTYKVEGKNVTVFGADGKTVIATITFDVDAPTEWLKGRDGVHYLFQSGIDRKVKVTVVLKEGGAFALDGDWAKVDGQNLGVVNDPSDFLAFGDQPGTYNFEASSFGLAVGPHRSSADKAGYVLDDRKAATNDARPVYWLDPSGKPVQIS